MAQYAIYCKNWLSPRWKIFSKPYYPTRWARFCKALGFPARYNMQMQELTYDPAQGVIDEWATRWGLDKQVLATHPQRVWLESTERRVSECFESRDLCAQVFETHYRHADDEVCYELGDETLWVCTGSVAWDMECAGHVFCDFYIKEVHEKE